MGRHLPEGESLSESASPAPHIVVHSLTHAVAALETAAAMDRAVALLSAPDAGIYVGPGWFKALVDAAREAMRDASFTAILDCGDDAGAAQGAIRVGIEAVIFNGRADVAARLMAIAVANGTLLLTRRPEATLDLGRWFFADGETLRRRCAETLGAANGDE